MVTQWTPYNKTDEWFKVFQEVRGKFPSYIKKWQTFAVVDEERGIKGYNIIMVEKGKGDDAMIDIANILVPFWKIEGFSMKIEVLTGMRDAIKSLGKAL
ncbi:MAG: hypothetical protein JSV62_08045 [Promethearchaeota archaeon]|nr:MAG: hypothetical protein JSV62_08045 [Candidatus Lokiarchaeota archaeon]